MDFFDEDFVLAEVAKAVDVDPADCNIEERRVFGSTAYEVSCGRLSWMVVEDEDEAERIALAQVESDLENEPELFGTRFLEEHIDTDTLRRRLESDVHSMTYDDLYEMNPKEFWSRAEEYGQDVPEEDEDGELPTPDRAAIEDLTDVIVEALLKDPIGYLEDIYGRDEAAKQAIEIAGIDIESAAAELVRYDGWAHFLCRYDGSYDTTKSGFVFWRD